MDEKAGISSEWAVEVAEDYICPECLRLSMSGEFMAEAPVKRRIRV
jgi:hypothetical protein